MRQWGSDPSSGRVGTFNVQRSTCNPLDHSVTTTVEVRYEDWRVI